MAKKEEIKVDMTTPTEPLQVEKIDVSVDANKPIVDIATPAKPVEKAVPTTDANRPYAVAPQAPQKSEVEQLQESYEAKQAINRGKESAINQAHEQERADAQRKQRNRQIVNSIADGLSAISNIVTTAHGAPDLGVGKTLMTAKAQERYDKAYKDAEDRRKEYLKIVREGNKEDLSNWYTQQKDAMAHRIKERETKVKEAEQKRKELQEKRLQAESEAKILLLNAKADEAEQKAIIAELYAAKTPEEVDLKLQEIRSRISKNNRSGRGGGSGSSSATKGNGFISVSTKIPLKNSDGSQRYDDYGRALFSGTTTTKLFYNTPEFKEYLLNNPDEARRLFGDNWEAMIANTNSSSNGSKTRRPNPMN
jgi:hypothetical protein